MLMWDALISELSACSNPFDYAPSACEQKLTSEFFLSTIRKRSDHALQAVPTLGL